ncbi:MAG: membrane protein insertase YidC [Planctomycetes bacterium]|nr:membrane protein insertase YidC [Planctomycetota bacterium]
MDRKQLLWLLLTLLLFLLVVPRFFGDRRPPQPEPTPQIPETTGWGYGGMRLSPEQIAADKVPAYTLGSVDPQSPYRFQLTLDPRGASVRYARLAGYYYTVQQKRTENKTPEQLEEWSYAVLSPVAGADGQAVLPFSTSDLLVAEEAGGPLQRIDTRMSPKYRLQGADDNGELFHFGWEPTELPEAEDGVQRTRFRLNLYDPATDTLAYTLIKTYEVRPGSYSFRMTVEVENHSGAARDLAIIQNGPTGIPLEDVRGDQREVIVANYMAGKGEVSLPKNGKTLRTKSLTAAQRQPLGTNAPDGDPVVWAGIANKFFASLMYPIPDGIDPTNLQAAVTPADLVVPPAQTTYDFHTQMVGTGEGAAQLVLVQTRPQTVAPSPAEGAAEPATQATQGASSTSLKFSYDVFVGPKDGEVLEAAPLHAMLNYGTAITFQSCQWCLVDPLARGVMWLIAAGGSLLHNYGLMIILLVLVIRLALHPITKRSQVSMLKMRKLQPQMQAIQEKYKDDKEGQQKAMMDFMRQTGFSPFLGCLPMLLQMPIWIALWAGLNASVALRHEGLLPFWITNLAGPDTVLHLAEPFTIPLLGRMMGPVTGLNLLPLLLAVFMFLQQKLMPMQAGPAGASKEQEQQQKIMMYFMSIFMLLIFYNAPSGLTLYIMASTAYGVVESAVIRKHIREREEQEAAAEVRVTAPGKRPRGTRPKKPRDRYRP